MHRHTAIASVLASLTIASLSSAAIVVNVGTVRQIAPRPMIEYTGAFASAVSSSLDPSATRTVTRFDLNAIVMSLGGDLALTEVRVYDAGGNSYSNWSPGADIDLMRIAGAIPVGTVQFAYSGGVAEHSAESSDTLRNRTFTCDAVSGDQHFNSQHFVSLGANGRAIMQFSGFLHNPGSTGGSGSGSGSGSGEGSGEGSGTGIGQSGGGEQGESGGSGGGTAPTYGGLLISQGIALEVSEAGLGEKWGVELVFEQAAVPSPGAIALIALAGLVGRRRR
jgi:MYXO-CTERM domain-containing protein